MISYQRLLAVALALLSSSTVSAFVVPSSSHVTTAATQFGNVLSTRTSSSSLKMMDLPLSVVADLGSTSDAFAASSLMISETEPWVQPLASVLGPFLNLFSFAMLCRVVISWYPTSDLNQLPYSLVAWPTEPLLRIIRGAVPPAFGVDITPIVWLAIFTFFNEILLGQQGLLTMKIKYGI